MIQRGGEVVIKMLANVQQQTIKPIIQSIVEPGTLIYTDEYDIYARLETWGYSHKIVVTALENMLEMTMGMGSVKSMSIPWKASGHYCVHG